MRTSTDPGWTRGARPRLLAALLAALGLLLVVGGVAVLLGDDGVPVANPHRRRSETRRRRRSSRRRPLAPHAEQVFDQAGPGRLVLVTCDDWNGYQYLSNAVVVASPQPI